MDFAPEGSRAEEITAKGAAYGLSIVKAPKTGTYNGTEHWIIGNKFLHF